MGGLDAPTRSALSPIWVSPGPRRSASVDRGARAARTACDDRFRACWRTPGRIAASEDATAGVPPSMDLARSAEALPPSPGRIRGHRPATERLPGTDARGRLKPSECGDPHDVSAQRYQSEQSDSVATATVFPSLTDAAAPAEVGEGPLGPLPEATRHPPLPLRVQDFTGGTSMSITTARQLARQAEEARRAARQHDYSVQSLRRQRLID